MISCDLRSLSEILMKHPERAPLVALSLGNLAERVAEQEREAVPAHLRTPTPRPLPEGVVPFNSRVANT